MKVQLLLAEDEAIAVECLLCLFSFALSGLVCPRLMLCSFNIPDNCNNKVRIMWDVRLYVDAYLWFMLPFKLDVSAYYSDWITLLVFCEYNHNL